MQFMTFPVVSGQKSELVHRGWPNTWRKTGQSSTLPMNIGSGGIQTRGIFPVVLLCPRQAQILDGLLRQCVIEDNLFNIPALAGRWCPNGLTLLEMELHF